MRVGIIGCGSIGSRHARNAAAMGHRVWTCDSDLARAEQLATVCGGFSATTGEHLADMSDAVLVCTPAATHADVARQLLKLDYKGPLFVEKPLATSVSDADVFSEWPHVTTQVGYNWLFHPLVDAMRSRLPSRHEVREAMLWMTCDKATWPGHDYADVLLEASHEVMVAVSLLGPAHCTSAVRQGEGWGLNLLHACGTLSRIALDDHCETVARGARFYTADSRGGYDVPPDDPRSQLALDESYRLELASFLKRAAAGTATECPFSDGLAVLKILDDARRLAGGAIIT